MHCVLAPISSHISRNSILINELHTILLSKWCYTACSSVYLLCRKLRSFIWWHFIFAAFKPWKLSSLGTTAVKVNSSATSCMTFDNVANCSNGIIFKVNMQNSCQHFCPFYEVCFLSTLIISFILLPTSFQFGWNLCYSPKRCGLGPGTCGLTPRRFLWCGGHTGIWLGCCFCSGHHTHLSKWQETCIKEKQFTNWTTMPLRRHQHSVSIQSSINLGEFISE